MIMSARRSTTIPELQGRVLVLGVGVTGISCVRRLRHMGVNVAVADTREQPPGADLLRRRYPDLQVFLGRDCHRATRWAELMLLSPGLPLTHPVVDAVRARDVPIWGDIELFARLTTASVLAVTGSNGKSTVTSLVADMARRSGVRVHAGGNLGPPALDLLDPHTELYVLELSSFQLETTHSLDAAAAVVLNVSADHQDRYAGLDSYAAAKARVYRGRGVQVINRDDPAVLAMARPGRKLVGFSRAAPNGEDFGVREHDSRHWLVRADQRLLPVSEVALSGAHNVSNALAALAMASVVGLQPLAMIEALQQFRGLPHRCQALTQRAGVLYIDDSKATNVAASVAAITGHPGPLVLIAGGLGKDQDFTPLRAALAGRTRAVVLIGKDGPRIEQVLGGTVATHPATNMRAAVELAALLAEPGDTVLLAPACASFDMFESFEDRGRQFAAAVRGLADGD